MSLIIANRSYKGISNLTIKRVSDNLVFNFPKPQGFVLADPQEQRQIMTRSELGEMVMVGNYTVSRSGSTAQVSYSVVQPELFSFQTGYLLESATALSMGIPKTLRVPESGVIPGVTTGQLGFELVVDTVAYASRSENGISTALTQNTFASHSTWKTTDDNFAIGVAGAMAFSDNLKGEIVTVLIPTQLNGNTISEMLIGEVTISCSLVNSLNKITLLEVYSALINPSSAALDSNGEGMQLDFNLLTPSGKCTSYKLLETQYSVNC